VQGVSTRKVKAITEELCGHSFSASSISAMNQKLDASLAQFAGRPLAEAFPYLILDARYERVREAGVITSQAVLIAIGIDWDGRRQVLAVELANRESRSSWRDFLLGLKARGLHGVEFVVADDHAGLRAALREVLAEAAYQRCYVHFLRNALDHVPRKVDDDCLQELRWLYDRRDLTEARRDLAAWLAKWSGKYSKLTGWVEDNIDETLTFYRLPRQHHKHLKSTNMLERLDEEIRRRTHVVRIFPNGESCLRLVRALAVDPRELARAAPLSQHGRSARAQEGGTAPCCLTPNPFSLAPCSLGQGRCTPVRPRRGGILDCRCARRSATRQVGTKGWSFAIEQRDAPLSDLNEPPHPNHDQFAELDAHNCQGSARGGYGHPATISTTGPGPWPSNRSSLLSDRRPGPAMAAANQRCRAPCFPMSP
jgi:putative transposase